MSKKVKVDKGYLEFLEEKVREREDFRRRAEIAEYYNDIYEFIFSMGPEDWKLYQDYVSNEWYKLPKELKENEIAFGRIMPNLGRKAASNRALMEFAKDNLAFKCDK
jgi:hypothetical protein